jgi:hypothetical protein
VASPSAIFQTLNSAGAGVSIEFVDGQLKLVAAGANFLIGVLDSNWHHIRLVLDFKTMAEGSTTARQLQPKRRSLVARVKAGAYTASVS